MAKGVVGDIDLRLQSSAFVEVVSLLLYGQNL